MKHFNYFEQVLRHKWFVFVECCKLGVPALGVLHDWSKFRLGEWIPYVRYFYGEYSKASEIWRQLPGYTGPTKESVENAFDLAWLHHQHRNKHHWQYWILVQDEDEDKVLPVPDKYRREMLADWRGAGRAYGNPDTLAWYVRHGDKMQLHPETRRWVEEQLSHLPRRAPEGSEW